MKKQLFRVFTVFLLFQFYNGFSQDLYNYENSKKFGEYLLKSGQFDMATKEYERLVFLNTTSDSLKLNLIKAYRLAGKFDTGLLRVSQLYPETAEMPLPHAMEYSKILMNKRSFPEAVAFWDESKTIPADDKILLKTTTLIFDSKFKNARAQLSQLGSVQNPLAAGYQSILDRGLTEKKKSPFLAAAFSSIIPGTGKAYTKNWKDGLISFVFVGAMTFQSYRMFNKHGVNDARGWIYGAIGTGFYIGNIYGSAKSANEYNRKKINALQHEASALFNTYY